MLSAVISLMKLGYWVVVSIDPSEINPMETPSTFQVNFSPSTRGERIAVKMIEKQDVEDIKIMFPKYSETIFKLWNQINLKLTAVEHDVECNDENSEPPE